MLSYSINKKYKYFWFRFFGAGLSVENTQLNPERFSERIGKSKSLTLFSYRIKILRRYK